MKNNITIHIKVSKLVKDMEEFHRKRFADLHNRANSDRKRPQRDKLALSNQASVHKEMLEFWQKVVLE